jgi:hypothetical protein
VYDLLYQVLKSGSMPRPTDPAIARLAYGLNSLLEIAKARAGGRDELEQQKTVNDAILVLRDILPTQRNIYTSALEVCERRGRRILEARANLAAFDALVSSAQVAHERGLLHLSNPLISLGRPAERWMDFAEYLAGIFERSLPGRPKDAAYRFIVKVVPNITGEDLVLATVAAAFRQNRFVNRGNRMR